MSRAVWTTLTEQLIVLGPMALAMAIGAFASGLLLRGLSVTAVTLIGLDGPSSTLEAGIMAQVEKGGAQETVALSELEAVDPDPDSAAWLAMYKYWRSKRG